MAQITPEKTKEIGIIVWRPMPEQDSPYESIKQVPTLCDFEELGKWLIASRRA